jgi:hypothetical protein
MSIKIRSSFATAPCFVDFLLYVSLLSADFIRPRFLMVVLCPIPSLPRSRLLLPEHVFLISIQ